MKKNRPNRQWFAAKKGLRRYIGPKRIIFGLVLIGLFLLARYLQQQGLLSPDILRGYIAVYPTTAIVLFVAIYAASVVTSLPTLPLNLAAGFFWGWMAGGILATVGSGLGAIIAFLAARAAFGKLLGHQYDHELVSWLQKELRHKGWRIIAFVRLNPVFPTGLLNYVFGLTSVKFTTYASTSVISLFFPSLIFAVIGDSAGTFLMDGPAGNIVRAILIISLAITLIFTIRFFTRYLNRKAAKE